MSRIDDIREIAEKVMGWNVETNRRLTWLLGNGWDCIDARWDPLTDADAALEVVEAMRRRRFRFEVQALGAAEGGWLSTFAVVFLQPNVSKRLPWQHAPTFCDAICQAALAAVRSEA